MRSIRKVALMVAAAAALVAVAAPTVSATVLQDSKGATLPKGSKISLTNNGQWTFLTSWGKLSCSEVTLPAELVAPVGETLKAVGGTGSAKYCLIGGKAWKVEPELRALALTSPTSGTMNLKITAWYPGLVNPCVYENTAAPVTYTLGGSVLKLTNAEMKSNGACGPFIINGESTVRDTLGNPLFLK